MNFDERGWRAETVRDYASFDRLRTYIWLPREQGGASVVEPIDFVMRELGDEGSNTEQAPSLRIPEGMAFALLNSFAAYFGGSSDVLRLQRDLQAERARVDKFIAHLTKETKP